MPKLLTPIHPGGIIREEILTPLAMSVNQLAKHLAVDAARLNEIVRGRRGITADTALRLARYLGTTPEFWLRLQVHYELRITRQAKQKESNVLCGPAPRRPRFLIRNVLPSAGIPLLVRERKIGVCGGATSSPYSPNRLGPDIQQSEISQGQYSCSGSYSYRFRYLPKNLCR
jgi:antitoxin HigA-1